LRGLLRGGGGAHRRAGCGYLRALGLDAIGGRCK
jgi:hypothetical protein